MHIRINDVSRAFEFRTNGNEPILHAGLSSGIDLPYECISGTCGSCKAKLVSGEIERLWGDAPGWKLTKAGEYLLCQCAALGPCTFETKSELCKDVANPPVAQQGHVRNRRFLNKDVMSFSVELNTPVEFRAGQFASLKFPGVDGARCYSMVNSNSPTNVLDFVIKRKPGGAVSRYMFETGDTETPVECFGPVGRAVFDPDTAHDLVLIAGGSGIAGMMSILERAGDCGHFDNHDGSVFFGVRGPADTFFLDELARFTSIYGRLKVLVAFSDSGVTDDIARAYPNLAFADGMVHEVAARSLQVRQSVTSAFIAGPPMAVNAALKVLLLKARIPAANIKYDKFG